MMEKYIIIIVIIIIIIKMSENTRCMVQLRCADKTDH